MYVYGPEGNVIAHDEYGRSQYVLIPLATEGLYRIEVVWAQESDEQEIGYSITFNHEPGASEVEDDGFKVPFEVCIAFIVVSIVVMTVMVSRRGVKARDQ